MIFIKNTKILNDVIESITLCYMYSAIKIIGRTVIWINCKIHQRIDYMPNVERILLCGGTN